MLAMDITLTSVGESYNLKHRTVMGMLWLQTHFADETWDLICSGQVNLNRQSSETLYNDATAAGVSVSMLPSVVCS